MVSVGYFGGGFQSCDFFYFFQPIQPDFSHALKTTWARPRFPNACSEEVYLIVFQVFGCFQHLLLGLSTTRASDDERSAEIQVFQPLIGIILFSHSFYSLFKNFKNLPTASDLWLMLFFCFEGISAKEIS